MKKAFFFMIIFLMVFAMSGFSAERSHKPASNAKTEQGPGKFKKTKRSPRRITKKRHLKPGIQAKDRKRTTTMYKY